SIDDSDADLAHDLRVLVRERVTAGDSNEQVIAFVRARYGDFVLLRPPFAIGTALLWGGPLLVLLLGGLAIARFYRRRDEAAPPPLSPEERQRLSALLAGAARPALCRTRGSGEGGRRRRPASRFQQGHREDRRPSERPPRRSDRLAVAGPHRGEPRAVCRSRRGLSPRRRSVRAPR